jgi:hypothetical protein
MEQRRLRLGDILDDYCPRERRVTNHAVVAMVEDDVKQTRCTTCDSEHPYKGGQEPRRRKKTATAALYREVLADMPEAAPPLSAAAEPAEEPPAFTAPATEPMADLHDEPAAEKPSDAVASSVTVAEPASASDEGPINRPLIRATLPRPEGQKDIRSLPEFTIRHGRGGQFRERHGNANGNGNRPHGRRFSGGHQAPMQNRGAAGRGGGFRGGQHQGQQQRHGGKKRSR